jgi:hypothetical protein
MSLSEDPIIPAEPPPARENPSAAQRGRRRRVTRREMIPMDAEGQAELIGSLAKRAFPSIELFVFSLACGAILGLGFMLDSQAVLLLGILLAPLMVPWVGFLLAILTGSPRFLFETSMALLISVILIFIGGVLTGFCMRLFLPHTLTNLYTHARLWIPELLVIAIGAVTLVASFIRSESRPFLPSVIIAYGFFLPVSAAGFGLGSGLPGVWPLGIYVSIVHIALASLLGLITLFILRIRPTSTGYIFSGVGAVIFIAILYILMVPGFRSSTVAAVTSTPTLTALPSPTSGLSPVSTNTIQPSNTPVSVGLTDTPTVITETLSASSTPSATPPSVTPVPLTLAVTLPASATPTITLTLEAQSISGKVSAVEGGGANLRQTPNGKYLMTLDNGTIVEIYPDFKIVNGVTWIHVFVTRNGQRVEGWLLESVVTYSTPEPNFDASATPGTGITPVP